SPQPVASTASAPHNHARRFIRPIARSVAVHKNPYPESSEFWSPKFRISRGRAMNSVGNLKGGISGKVGRRGAASLLVSMVKLSDGESIRVRGEHREIADKLAQTL